MTPWRVAAGRVARDVFLQYSVVVLILLAVTAAGISSPIGSKLAWFGLAWIAVAVAADLLGAVPRQLLASRARTGLAAAGVAALILVGYALRAWLQRTSAYPLGYDYGFYRTAMDSYAAHSHIPEATLPHWIKDQFEPGVLYLHVALSKVAGIDAYEHLRWLFPIVSAGLVVPLYAAARDRFGPLAGLAAGTLYTASFAQFTVYEYLYEKNVLGLALWLALVVTLRRRAWFATGLLLGGIGFLHRPTFLLALVTMAPAAIKALLGRGDRIRLLRLAVALPLFLPLWLLRAKQYFGVALLQVQAVGDNVGRAVPEGGGTFLGFLQYQNAAAAYLPVAVAGAVALWRRGERAVSVALLACFANVALHLVFFNRFIIMLDLVAVLTGGVVYLLYLAALRPRWRASTLALVVLIAAAPTVDQATRPAGPPYVWLNGSQKDGLAWVRDHVPADATLLASNLDGPYVAADTGRRTYAPGLFDDPHTGTQWRGFFTEHNNQSIQAFLAAYPQPLFLVHATGHGPGLGTSKYTEPWFHLEYDAGGLRVWSYHPGP